jgi:hypothetical protein
MILSDEVRFDVAAELALQRHVSTEPFRRLYYGETTFDFVRRKRIWFTISTVVILLGVLSLAVRGLDIQHRVRRRLPHGLSPPRRSRPTDHLRR